MICADVQAMKGGVDVNGMLAQSRRFYPGDGHVHRQDAIRAAHGFSNLEHVCSDCRDLGALKTAMISYWFASQIELMKPRVKDVEARKQVGIH